MATSLSKIPYGVIEPVKPKAAEIIAATGDAVTHVWGASTTPDHNNLRCVDFMVANIADGDRVADYVIRHHERLGVNGIIWNGRVMGFPHPGNSSYRGPAGTWRPYNGPNPHRDHPHVEFDASPYVAGDTAKPAPKPDKPKPAPGGDTRPDPILNDPTPKDDDMKLTDVVGYDPVTKQPVTVEQALRQGMEAWRAPQQRYKGWVAKRIDEVDERARTALNRTADFDVIGGKLDIRRLLARLANAAKIKK